MEEKDLKSSCSTRQIKLNLMFGLGFSFSHFNARPVTRSIQQKSLDISAKLCYNQYKEDGVSPDSPSRKFPSIINPMIQERKN